MANECGERRAIHVIKPDSRLEKGVSGSLLNLLEEIWRFRHHIGIVFRGQFKAAYAGTGLGLFWNFFLPIVPLTIYWLLAEIRVFPEFEGVDSATYITYGVTLWFVLVGCIQIPISVIQSRGSEVMKTSFPLSAAIVSSFAQLVFETLVRLTLVIIIIFLSGSSLELTSAFLPLIIFPAFLLCAGLGLLFGILNVVYKDVGRVVSITLQYGIFLSGVIFPLPSGNALFELLAFNPFYIFLSEARSVVFSSTYFVGEDYLLLSGISVLVFLLSARLFYLMEYRIRGVS